MVVNGTQIRCRVFEDNTGSRVIATVQIIRPRTKHINTKYWHFVENVESGMITKLLSHKPAGRHSEKNRLPYDLEDCNIIGKMLILHLQCQVGE